MHVREVLNGIFYVLWTDCQMEGNFEGERQSEPTWTFQPILSWKRRSLTTSPTSIIQKLCNYLSN